MTAGVWSAVVVLGLVVVALGSCGVLMLQASGHADRAKRLADAAARDRVSADADRASASASAREASRALMEVTKLTVPYFSGTPGPVEVMRDQWGTARAVYSVPAEPRVPSGERRLSDDEVRATSRDLDPGSTGSCRGDDEADW